MSRWGRLTKAGGIAVGAAAATAGVALAAEKIAVGRLRLRPDPAADEPLGQLRGRPLTVLADDGLPLYTEVSGPEDAPVTVVFSHGYTLNQDCWHYQRQALAGSARLVLWDQRGHGRTGGMGPDERSAAERAAADQALATELADYRDAPQRAPEHAVTGHVSIDQLGADLACVLAAAAPGDGPVILAGHSMGGMTIMALARQRPELFGTKVAGTVLVSTAASGIDPVAWLPGPLRLVGRQAAPALLGGVAHGRPATLVERGREVAGDLAFLSTRWLAFGDATASPALVDFAERMIRATPVAVISEFYLALRAHDQRAGLAALGQAPAVVLIGDRDRLVAPRLAGELADGIPGADLVLVPGAGHLLPLERPEIVTDAIAALVADAARPSGRRPRTA
jgi:pimeloyl-ACP methyl ester carboxylesterase